MANFYDFLIFTQCQNEMKFVKLIERYELMKIFNGGVFRVLVNDANHSKL